MAFDVEPAGPPLSVRTGTPTPVYGATRDTADTARLIEDAAAAFRAEYAEAPRSDLIVVIPAFNEEGSVEAVIRAVPGEIAGASVTVLVMDDGSSDATAALARGTGAMVCSVARNVGQGVVFRLGYRLASERGARFIATVDADGQFDPRELPGLVAPLVAGRADFVNGSRRLGQNSQADRVRRAGVVVFGRLLSLLTGVRITDPSHGLRAWRTEVTDTVRLRQTQYQTSELLIRTIAHGFRVEEAPASMYERTAGHSKKGRNWRYAMRFGRVVVTTWWEERSRVGGLVLRRSARP